MERINKLIVLADNALSELGQINFAGLSTIPAGRAMESIYVLKQELNQMKELAADRDDNDREVKNG